MRSKSKRRGASDSRVISEVNRERVHVPRAKVTWLKVRVNPCRTILQDRKHDLARNTLLVEFNRGANRS